VEEHVLAGRKAAATFTIRPAERQDAGDVLRLIRALAAYEKLEHMAAGTEAMLSAALFGPRPACEALVAERG